MCKTWQNGERRASLVVKDSAARNRFCHARKGQRSPMQTKLRIKQTTDESRPRSVSAVVMGLQSAAFLCRSLIFEQTTVAGWGTTGARTDTTESSRLANPPRHPVGVEEFASRSGQIDWLLPPESASFIVGRIRATGRTRHDPAPICPRRRWHLYQSARREPAPSCGRLWR